MKFCTRCGKQIIETAVVCPCCGVSQRNYVIQNNPDYSSFGLAFLGFCLPVVGLILYIVWHDNFPLKAKSVGKGALIGVIVSITAPIIIAIIFGMISCFAFVLTA